MRTAVADRTGCRRIGRNSRTLPLLPFLAGCGGSQSAFAPIGPQAESILTLSWVLFTGAAVIFAGVMLICLAGMVWPGRFRLDGRRFMILGGFAFPTVALIGLTAYTTLVGADLARAGSGGEPLRIEVEGAMFWWRVRYPDTPHGAVVTANEIHIPVGRPVEFHLSTRDVIHSLWIPTLHGKRDLIPGRINRITMTADRPGVVRGQCAEFCGEQHAQMALFVVAHEPPAFDAWLAAQARPAPAPADALAEEGRRAVLANGCIACHSLRGLTEEDLPMGGVGPDLTHVGGRLSIGAGTLPNDKAALVRWIARSQAVKHGTLMPNFTALPAETIDAMAHYLEGLQ